MTFALWDYLSYRLRRGRYGRNIRRNALAAGWENGIPNNILDVLRDGDGLAFLTFDSFLAWLVMYFTSTSISHVGIYAHPRRILHMTLSGTALEPLSNYFRSNIWILPAKFPEAPRAGRSVDDFYPEYAGKRYSYWSAVWKGLNIIAGRNWPYFRWKFVVDLIFLMILVVIPVWGADGLPFVGLAGACYGGLVLVNAIRWRLSPLHPDHPSLGVPADILHFFEFNQATIIGDAYSVRGQAHGFPIYRPPPSGS
jgi:hypothetical protein